MADKRGNDEKKRRLKFMLTKKRIVGKIGKHEIYRYNKI